MKFNFLNTKNIENLPGMPVKEGEYKFRPDFKFLKKNTVFAILAGVFILSSSMIVKQSLYNDKFPESDLGSFQTVFLTNGQAYFGKLENFSKDYVKLSNIYYLQVPGLQSNNGLEAEKTKKAELIKLGGEVHGPKDYMYIPKGQIMFWEDLDSTSQIYQTISNSL